jgi:hypothetical protein
MATGGDNVIGSDFDYSTVEINKESLYSSEWVPGVASSAQRIPYINLPVIEYNPEIEKNKDESIFDSAELKQMDVMEDFSKWLLSNGWEFHYSLKIWINHENSNQYLFTEVYQMFLKSKEA